MTNPVLVEVSRGSLVESRHRGAAAVVDSAGASVLALGDIDRPVFLRSAVKALQALPLIESGAADDYGDEELAVICASHGGEPDHVEAVKRLLARSGLSPLDLECGAHWPSHADTTQTLLRQGAHPSALHNNCSGKHAGFLCLAGVLAVDHRGYGSSVHPVQQAVREAISRLTGEPLAEDRCAVDGCSVPTYAVPLKNLALAFARFGTGGGMSQRSAAAAARLRAACAARPWYVAGTGRFCTAIMAALGARVFVKTGAEGVFCAAFPELGYGVALKIDDGATRAAQAAMAALIVRFLPLSSSERVRIEGWMRPELRNWNDIPVGRIEPAPILRD